MENSYGKDGRVYLILGGGIAAVSAAEAARKQDAHGRVVIVGEEPLLPYSRPMMTKTPLRDYRSGRYLVHPEEWYREREIEIYTNCRAESLDAGAKSVLFAGGESLSYDKCVYALGAESFLPPISGSEKKGVTVLRRSEDMERLRKLALEAEDAVVIGGGVIGLETAWELCKAGLQVTVLEVEKAVMERVLDEETSRLLQRAAQEKGIRVRTGATVEEITGNGRADGVRLADGTVLPAQLVVVSAGIRPNKQLLEAAGGLAERAVVVNERMETSLPDVYACGDCAQFGGRNDATWAEAEEQGKVAGTNAAGGRAAFAGNPSPIIMNALDTSLFAMGDLGKGEQGGYKVYYGSASPAPDTFQVNEKKVKESYAKYVVLDGRIVGAALLGSLKDAVKLKKAVAEQMPYEQLSPEGK